MIRIVNTVYSCLYYSSKFYGGIRGSKSREMMRVIIAYITCLYLVLSISLKTNMLFMFRDRKDNGMAALIRL